MMRRRDATGYPCFAAHRPTRRCTSSSGQRRQSGSVSSTVTAAILAHSSAVRTGNRNALHQLDRLVRPVPAPGAEVDFRQNRRPADFRQFHGGRVSTRRALPGAMYERWKRCSTSPLPHLYDIIQRGCAPPDQSTCNADRSARRHVAASIIDGRQATPPASVCRQQ